MGATGRSVFPGTCSFGILRFNPTGGADAAFGAGLGLREGVEVGVLSDCRAGANARADCGSEDCAALSFASVPPASST